MMSRQPMMNTFYNQTDFNLIKQPIFNIRFYNLVLRRWKIFSYNSVFVLSAVIASWKKLYHFLSILINFDCIVILSTQNWSLVIQ